MDIMKVVCEVCGVTEAVLKTQIRNKSFVEARCIFYYLSRKLQGKSAEEMRKCFGQDRTTVVHSLKKAEDFLMYDKNFKNRVDLIELKLRQ